MKRSTSLSRVLVRSISKFLFQMLTYGLLSKSLILAYMRIFSRKAYYVNNKRLHHVEVITVSEFQISINHKQTLNVGHSEDVLRRSFTTPWSSFLCYEYLWWILKTVIMNMQLFKPWTERVTFKYAKPKKTIFSTSIYLFYWPQQLITAQKKYNKAQVIRCPRIISAHLVIKSLSVIIALIAESLVNRETH